jgi:hypothetical protein
MRKLPVVPMCRSEARLWRRANHKHLLARPAPTRGALRGRHGRWKRDAVDAAVSRDERTEADGKGVWSWRPDADAKFLRSKLLRDDGGKRARSPRRARSSPLKPSRRECRLIAAYLWLLTRVLSTLAHAAAGATRTRHSLRPLISSRANRSGITRADSCRGNADLYLSAVMPRESGASSIPEASRISMSVSGILHRPIQWPAEALAKAASRATTSERGAR